MPTAEEKKIGLRFEGAVPADELQRDQIVVVDGHVVETRADPSDPGRVEIVVARLLAGVEGQSDERTVIVSVPRDMRIATASRFEGEPPPVTGP